MISLWEYCVTFVESTVLWHVNRTGPRNLWTSWGNMLSQCNIAHWTRPRDQVTRSIICRIQVTLAGVTSWTMASSPPTSVQCAHIRELSELKSISGEDLPLVFLTSISTIFSYSIEDVTKSIEDFSKYSIGKLYRLLCDKAANTFTQYKGRKLW